MSCKHGGAAFPQVNLKDYQGMLIPDLQKGMTLRDYFAAKAMQGLVGAPQSFPRSSIAEHAYLMADEMLKAREE